MSLYIPLRKMKSGLQLWRCLRTSSALEGYHLHYRETVSALCKASGPRWRDVVVGEFNFRWVVRALKL